MRTPIVQIEKINQALKDFGIVVEIGTDFDYFARLFDRQGSTRKLSEAFNGGFHVDEMLQEISDENCFWLAAYSGNGTLVHTGAMRLFELDQMRFGDFLASNLWAFRAPAISLSKDKTTINLSSEVDSMTGKICYHGEQWTKSFSDKKQGNFISALLGRVIIALAIKKWQLDCVFSLHSPKSALTGYPVRQGYSRIEQTCIVWSHAQTGIRIEDWLAWMRHDEAVFNLELPSEVITSIYAQAHLANNESTKNNEK